jgi:hypothetical protein
MTTGSATDCRALAVRPRFITPLASQLISLLKSVSEATYCRRQIVNANFRTAAVTDVSQESGAAAPAVRGSEPQSRGARGTCESRYRHR